MSTDVDVVVTSEELRRRTVLRTDLKPDRVAFLDTKIPGSERKVNFPLIGPGVSENPDQVVPVTARHGFNLGGAAMPAGVVNNLHLHTTAEVFMCMGGAWQFRWGVDGTDGEATVSDGDVISIPTWIFRGFTSKSDDAWLYTALGRDDGGGLIWAPSVIARAAETGMFLSNDGKLIEVAPGTHPDGVELAAPLSAEQLATLSRVTLDEMRARLATPADLAWEAKPFLDCMLPGGGAQLALVIGYGVTENRLQRPRLTEPHGFSLAWLLAEPGRGMLRHRVREPQVLIVKSGQVRVTLNDDDREVSTEIGPFDTLSVPPNAWRRYESIGEAPAQIAVITAGDDRVYLDWAPEVAAAALDKDLVLDPNGYIAPPFMLPRQPNRAATAHARSAAAFDVGYGRTT